MRPLALTRAAIVLLGLFAIAHLLGMRDATSFLSGTAGGDGSWELSVIMGTTYLLLYLAALLLAPVLLIASALRIGLERLTDRRDR